MRMKNPNYATLLEGLSYPAFYLDEEFKLLYSNPFAKAHTPCLCCKEELLFRIRQNNVAYKNLIDHISCTILLYDVSVSFRLLTVIPLAPGYLATLSAPPFMAEYPLSFAEQLRQPLAEIFASLPILSQHTNHSIADLHLQQVNKNCYALLRSASILTSLARISKGQAGIAHSLDICSLVSTISRAVSDVSLPGTPPIRCTVPSQTLAVRGEGDLLGGMLENLLSNSLRFTRDGNRVSVTLRKIGSQAVLTVRDFGSGIRPEVLPYVFDTYYSAPIWPENPAPGLGLGLSYIYALASMLKGYVTLESVWGEGTSVSISLPLDNSGDTPEKSVLANYITDRYSSLYIELHEFCRLPEV